MNSNESDRDPRYSQNGKTLETLEKTNRKKEKKRPAGTGLASLTGPCKVLPTLTISWFPKLVFFGSIIFLLHSTSKPLHLLLLHSMSSPGWFLLVLQAQVRGYQLREDFLHPHGDPSKHYILILFMKQITT